MAGIKLTSLVENTGSVSQFNPIFGTGMVRLLAINPTKEELKSFGLEEKDIIYVESTETSMPHAWIDEEDNMQYVKKALSSQKEAKVPVSSAKVVFLYKTVDEVDTFDELGQPMKKHEFIMDTIGWYQNTISFIHNEKNKKETMTFINSQGKTIWVSLPINDSVANTYADFEKEAMTSPDWINGYTYPMSSPKGYNSRSVNDIIQTFYALSRTKPGKVSDHSTIDNEDTFLSPELFATLNNGSAEDIKEALMEAGFEYFLKEEKLKALTDAITKHPKKGAGYAKDFGHVKLVVAINFKDGPDILWSQITSVNVAYKGQIANENCDEMIKEVTALAKPAENGQVYDAESKMLRFSVEKGSNNKIVGVYGFRAVDPKKKSEYIPGIKEQGYTNRTNTNNQTSQKQGGGITSPNATTPDW